MFKVSGGEPTRHHTKEAMTPDPALLWGTPFLRRSGILLIAWIEEILALTAAYHMFDRGPGSWGAAVCRMSDTMSTVISI